jgi:hypothetical protein
MSVLTQLSLAGLLDIDFPTIFGGHSGFGTGPTREPNGGDDEGGGIGMATVVAVVLLGLVTVAVLFWLSRQEKGSGNEKAARALKPKTIAPAGLIAVVIATPLIVWTASSGGGDEKRLIVERWTNDAGAPELIVSLTEDDLNTLKTTDGKRAVRVECLGREGQMVLVARQRWPFTLREPGYDYPHTHQAASREQVQRADRCRVRGARVRLEADVEGALTG